MYLNTIEDTRLDLLSVPLPITHEVTSNETSKSGWLGLWKSTIIFTNKKQITVFRPVSNTPNLLFLI